MISHLSPHKISSLLLSFICLLSDHHTTHWLEYLIILWQIHSIKWWHNIKPSYICNNIFFFFILSLIGCFMPTNFCIILVIITQYLNKNQMIDWFVMKIFANRCFSQYYHLQMMVGFRYHFFFPVWHFKMCCLTLMAARRVSSTTSIRRSLCSYRRFCSSAALFSSFTCSTAVKLFCKQQSKSYNTNQNIL